jgi:Domain of unknown function (DUF4399)
MIVATKRPGSAGGSVKTLVGLSVLICVAVFAQAADTAAPVAGTPALTSPSPEGASVYFIEPVDGAVVPPTFTVKFGLKGMGVAPAGTDVPNTGHHHLLVDRTALPDPALPLPVTDHILHFGKGQTETVLTLPPGKHTLQLVFGNYLHVPHTPPVESARITITVAE